MLVVKYWTFLFVGSVVLSLSSYVIMTSLTQSLWMYKISPKTFPFLCELPLASGGRELSGYCPLAEGGEGGWHSHPTICLTPVADYNVLREPSSLLLIVLNVVLNTLPLLAWRTIHRTVLKRRPKVRESWRTTPAHHPSPDSVLGTSSGAQIPEYCVLGPFEPSFCHSESREARRQLLEWFRQNRKLEAH